MNSGRRNNHDRKLPGMYVHNMRGGKTATTTTTTVTAVNIGFHVSKKKCSSCSTIAGPKQQTTKSCKEQCLNL